MKKQYLGDGVYAAPGSYLGEVVLTTEDGISVTNTIVLEPEVALALIAYLQSTLMDAQRWDGELTSAVSVVRR